MKVVAGKAFNPVHSLDNRKVFYNRLAYRILRCALDDKGKSHYSYGAVPLKEKYLFHKDFSLCHPERSEGSGTPFNLKRRYRKNISFCLFSIISLTPMA